MNQNDTFINYLYVTNSSMTEVITKLKEENYVETLCRNNSLNLSLLRSLFKVRMRGYNNTKIAELLGVHRVTIQRYVETLRNLRESEFEQLYNYLTKEENGTED